MVKIYLSDMILSQEKMEGGISFSKNILYTSRILGYFHRTTTTFSTFLVRNLLVLRGGGGVGLAWWLESMGRVSEGTMRSSSRRIRFVSWEFRSLLWFWTGMWMEVIVQMGLNGTLRYDDDDDFTFLCREQYYYLSVYIGDTVQPPF